jgi:hypothetical protein
MPVFPNPTTMRPRAEELAPAISRPIALGALVPSNLISGAPAKPGCVVPSMSISVEMVGSALAGVMVCRPLPMLNVIVSAPANALASSIAARSVHTAPAVAQAPLPAVASLASPVLLTTNVAASARSLPASSAPTTPHTNVHERSECRITAHPVGAPGWNWRVTVTRVA